MKSNESIRSAAAEEEETFVFQNHYLISDRSNKCLNALLLPLTTDGLTK
jgi:hypothetical protein